MFKDRAAASLLPLVAVLTSIVVSCRRNRPPDEPPTPGGPASVIVGDTGRYVTSTTDPDGDAISYQFDWGDGTQSAWSPLVGNGEAATMSKAWPTQSTYSVRSRAKDEKDTRSDWSPEFRVTTIPNYAPALPSIAGPALGYEGITYTYTLLTADPNGDSVSYQADWGDGTQSAWSAFVPSGATATLANSWSEARNYYVVKARAKDSREAVSSWTPEMPVVIMPNDPPDRPPAPWGPQSGYVGRAYEFDAETDDPDGDSICYQFHWGRSAADTTAWSDLLPSGRTIHDTITWSQIGTYLVKVRARDAKGAGSEWSEACTVAIEPERMLWRFAVDGEVLSSPAIGPDGTIYFGTTYGWVFAVYTNGSQRWHYEAGEYFPTSPAVGPDGTVHICAFDGYLYAFYPTGSLRWRYPLGDHTFSSPAVGADGTVYLGADDFHLYAIHPNGSLKWRCPVNDCIRSSPAVGTDGTVYVGADNWDLHAVNPDGSVKWRYPTGLDISSSPAIGSDGTVYIGSQDRYLYAVNPDGSPKWRYLTGGRVTSSPAVSSDGTVYVGSEDGYLYAINPDGSLGWRHLLGSDIYSSPAIGPDGTVYIGSDDGYLYAIQGSGPLATSAWPKFHHDNQNTGQAGGGQDR